MEYFKTFDSEKDALDYKRANRIRKCIINYSEYCNCWICVRTAKRLN